LESFLTTPSNYSNPSDSVRPIHALACFQRGRWPVSSSPCSAWRFCLVPVLPAPGPNKTWRDSSFRGCKPPYAIGQRPLARSFRHLRVAAARSVSCRTVPPAGEARRVLSFHPHASLLRFVGPARLCIRTRPSPRRDTGGQRPVRHRPQHAHVRGRTSHGRSSHGKRGRGPNVLQRHSRRQPTVQTEPSNPGMPAGCQVRGPRTSLASAAACISA